jgi:hypothetical protein
MKRKIKRKLFLMGMAITAGLPGVAFAKGGGKAEREAGLHASQWQSVNSSALAGDMDLGAAESAGLYSRLKTIVDRMNYSVEVPAAQAKPKAWRLEMLPLGSGRCPPVERRETRGYRLARRLLRRGLFAAWPGVGHKKGCVKRTLGVGGCDYFLALMVKVPSALKVVSASMNQGCRSPRSSLTLS